MQQSSSFQRVLVICIVHVTNSNFSLFNLISQFAIGHSFARIEQV